MDLRSLESRRSQRSQNAQLAGLLLTLLISIKQVFPNSQKICTAQVKYMRKYITFSLCAIFHIYQIYLVESRQFQSIFSFTYKVNSYIILYYPLVLNEKAHVTYTTIFFTTFELFMVIFGFNIFFSCRTHHLFGEIAKKYIMQVRYSNGCSFQLARQNLNNVKHFRIILKKLHKLKYCFIVRFVSNCRY